MNMNSRTKTYVKTFDSFISVRDSYVGIGWINRLIFHLLRNNLEVKSPLVVQDLYEVLLLVWRWINALANMGSFATRPDKHPQLNWRWKDATCKHQNCTEAEQIYHQARHPYRSGFSSISLHYCNKGKRLVWKLGTENMTSPPKYITSKTMLYRIATK